MSILKIEYSPFEDERGRLYKKVSKDNFNKFNQSILGLGEISEAGENIQALAAIFDLEGFTSFCNQREPQINVPDFLSRFLSWFFEQISKYSMKEEEDDSIILFSSLPFFAKFLGDGILFLWDINNCAGLKEIGRIIFILNIICKQYSLIFLKKVSSSFNNLPPRLRCGIAQGLITSIGNGLDFVGPCINIASKLQKLSSLGFVFSKIGFNIEIYPQQTQESFLTKRVTLSGIGKELIYVRKDEFELLADEDKKLFDDV